jgi:hypothetical protein
LQTSCSGQSALAQHSTQSWLQQTSPPRPAGFAPLPLRLPDRSVATQSPLAQQMPVKQAPSQQTRPGAHGF